MKKALAFLALSCIAAGRHVSASLLIDTDNNVSLQSGGTFDNTVTARRFVGFAGQFYGLPFTTVDVSTNGNLNFSNNSDFNNTPLPTTVPRISYTDKWF